MVKSPSSNEANSARRNRYGSRRTVHKDVTLVQWRRGFAML
jgi:hypothetical protein